MSLTIFLITSILLIISIIKFPKIKKLDTYYIIAAIGAILMIIFNQISFKEIYHTLFENEITSPIQILILFISMTFLSITLDCLGFFDYIAYKAASNAHGNQKKLFVIFFIIISILTIFTSNDVVILTFTPFICCFSKKAKINPIPYLVSELIAANTLSMMLLIGNPTNILLSLASNISFIEYLRYMILPTTITTLIIFIVLFILFRKSLNKTIEATQSFDKHLNKPLIIISIIHIVLATILLALSNILHFEMYLITLILALSLFIITLLYTLISKNEKSLIPHTLKRLPYGLIPFLISMFILVEALNLNGYTNQLASLLNIGNEVFSYGYSSLLFCNLINNIPMSVLYSNTLVYNSNIKAVYAVIIGSNIGAYLTPLGALAGIMFMNIIKTFNIDFTYKHFIKYGLLLSILASTIALVTLYII